MKFKDLVTRVQSNQNDYSGSRVAQDMHNILREQNKYGVPIDLLVITKSLGFEVRGIEEGKMKYSGVITVDEKLKPILGTPKGIGIVQTIKPGKKRFVVAHELAHYLFDYKPGEPFTSYYTSSDSSNPSEQKANEFAAELLMPTSEFSVAYRRYLKSFPFEIVIQRLAECVMGMSEANETDAILASVRESSNTIVDVTTDSTFALAVESNWRRNATQ